MKSLRNLQRKVDARRGDASALAALGEEITRAVRRYKREPTVANYKRIASAVQAMPKGA